MKLKFLDLIENQHIFATGCTYQWSEESLIPRWKMMFIKCFIFPRRSMFFYKGNNHNLAKNFQKLESEKR